MGDPDHDSLEANLITEYGTVLDISTLLAIISDYDLGDPAQLQAAREILDLLKESAKQEEESGFDASGSSGVDTLQHGEGIRRGECKSASESSLPGWSGPTEDTSISQGTSQLDITESFSDIELQAEDTAYPGLDDLDQDTKESRLLEMFPKLKPFDIMWALKKNKWDINNAMNDLMTQAFMQETGTIQRGIEAFSETDLPAQSRKGKRKKRNRALDDLTSPVSSETPSPTSKWDSGKQDIEFIATRTFKTTKEIASLYHNNGASVRKSIEALLEEHIARGIDSDDSLIQSRAIDLGHKFPGISQRHLEPLVHITFPSTTYAKDLAGTLVIQPLSSEQPNIQFEFRRPPILLDESPKTKPKTFDAVKAGKAAISLEAATTRATKYSQERDTAFSKASAAWRKGKSDHMMGAAAAYYSEVGRTADSRAKSALSAAADALALSQSSRTELDLHGINVQDAKRITKERVTSWWHELGQNSSGSRVSGVGYRIVTGVGHHSEGGKSKLAPAVLNMLVNDGWKVQVGTGVLVVTGIAPVTKRK